MTQHKLVQITGLNAPAAAFGIWSDEIWVQYGTGHCKSVSFRGTESCSEKKKILTERKIQMYKQNTLSLRKWIKQVIPKETKLNEYKKERKKSAYINANQSRLYIHNWILHEDIAHVLLHLCCAFSKDCVLYPHLFYVLLHFCYVFSYTSVLNYPIDTSALCSPSPVFCILLHICYIPFCILISSIASNTCILLHLCPVFFSLLWPPRLLFFILLHHCSVFSFLL